MRDNVSKLGTIMTGLAALPVNKNNITGQSVNVSAYNAATLYIPAGTWTDGTHTFTVQESPDNTTWSNVASTDLLTWSAPSATVTYPPVRQGYTGPAAISSAATAVNQRVGYLGAQPYVRVNVAVTGSPVTGAQYDCLWVLGEPRNLPSAV